jgi:hypothetical protein
VPGDADASYYSRILDDYLAHDRDFFERSPAVSFQYFSVTLWGEERCFTWGQATRLPLSLSTFTYFNISISFYFFIRHGFFFLSFLLLSLPAILGTGIRGLLGTEETHPIYRILSPPPLGTGYFSQNEHLMCFSVTVYCPKRRRL